MEGRLMQGMMMEVELTITSMIQHAAKYHADADVVSRLADGSTHRYSYAELYGRAMQFANVLESLGVVQGDIVGTLAWNDYRHLEAYFSVPCMGAICHTINPRLFAEQIAYIISHAQDKVLVVDPTTLALLETIEPSLSSVKAIIVMCHALEMPATSLQNVYCYETLMAQHNAHYVWPDLDEKTASSLCYTSGTTGNPKGVLYSHRSTALQVLSICGADYFGISNRDAILTVVPMFHINAWTMPYAAATTGAKLILPGPDLGPENLYDLIESEQATLTAGVPTVWSALLEYLDRSGKNIASLQRLVIGGSAPPMSLIKAFEEKHDTRVMQGWGMTECSGAATHHRFTRGEEELPQEQRYQIQARSGRPFYLVDIKVVDDDGNELPNDGKTAGHLYVRGPWIASSYFKSDAKAVTQGWLETGDIANIGHGGSLQIVDRDKDLIKSGGEWISSIDIEKIVSDHDAIDEAAVIAIPHPKWSERPLLIVKKKADRDISKEGIYAFLNNKIAKWWMPDDIVFIESIPKQATGKVSKLALREKFNNYISTADNQNS